MSYYFLLKVIEAYVDHDNLRQEIIVAWGSLAVAEAWVIYDLKSFRCYFEVTILFHSHVNQSISIVFFFVPKPIQTADYHEGKRGAAFN